MQTDEDIIAKKYAKAFYNLYVKDLSLDEVEKYNELEQFLQEQKDFYISLRIPSIPLSTKKMVLKKVCEEFELPKGTVALMNLLLDHRRIEILHRVLRQIRYCYKNEKNIQSFKIATSRDITGAQQEKILDYARSISNAQVIPEFEVDPELIIGIRIESITFLWERSIKALLRNISQSLLIKG